MHVYIYFTRILPSLSATRSLSTVAIRRYPSFVQLLLVFIYTSVYIHVYTYSTDFMWSFSAPTFLLTAATNGNPPCLQGVCRCCLFSYLHVYIHTCFLFSYPHVYIYTYVHIFRKKFAFYLDYSNTQKSVFCAGASYCHVYMCRYMCIYIFYKNHVFFLSNDELDCFHQ